MNVNIHSYINVAYLCR